VRGADVLPNATTLELTFTSLLLVASPISLFATRRAWRRIGAVEHDPPAKRAAIDWLRARVLLGGFIFLALWAAVMALFSPAPPESLATSSTLRRVFGMVIAIGSILDAIWTGWSDHRFAQDLDPVIEARLDDAT
jgi:hypothetical protein